VKSSAEQQFLYGNHIMKSGLGRITENTRQYQGVIVYSMNDVPLVRLSVCLSLMFSFNIVYTNLFVFVYSTLFCASVKERRRKLDLYSAHLYE